MYFSVLPKPRRQLLSSEQQDKYERKYDELESIQQRKQPPPYGQRDGWKPRTQEDFGSGGAFPEIHIAQYPLDMGRSSTVSTLLN
jgi:SNW domain-containing protein 1